MDISKADRDELLKLPAEALTEIARAYEVEIYADDSKRNVVAAIIKARAKS